jgi:hypothetical protein
MLRVFSRLSTAPIWSTKTSPPHLNSGGRVAAIRNWSFDLPPSSLVPIDKALRLTFGPTMEVVCPFRNRCSLAATALAELDTVVHAIAIFIRLD